MKTPIREPSYEHDCSYCPLLYSRYRPSGDKGEMDRSVPGAGSVKSGIVFVGEAPGDVEVAEGAPLVGPTGWWFTCLLNDAGLQFADVYRTNAIMCQPSGKGSELKGVEWQAATRCAPSLRHELNWLVEVHGIKVIVPMGGAALKGVLPDCPYTITKARGYVFKYWEGYQNCWVVPTIHPSPRNLRGRGDIWTVIVQDFKKAARIAKHGGPSHPEFKRVTNPTVSDVYSFFRNKYGYMSVDVENTQDGRLVCVGFCDGETTLVVPFLKQGGGEYWNPEGKLSVMSCLRQYLGDPARSKWMQNGIHDTTILEQNGLPVKGWTMDTMLMTHACWPDQAKSLHHLGSMFCEIPPWKPADARPEGTEPEVTK